LTESWIECVPCDIYPQRSEPCAVTCGVHSVRTCSNIGTDTDIDADTDTDRWRHPHRHRHRPRHRYRHRHTDTPARS